MNRGSGFADRGHLALALGLALAGAATTEAGPADNAVYVRQNVPAQIAPGAVTQATVTMRNTGTTAWTPAAGYKLRSLANHWGMNRVYVPTPTPPGSEATFNITLTAPASAGAYDFQWRMEDGATAQFGPSTPLTAIAVASSPVDGAALVEQSVFGTMQPGEPYRIRVRMRNSGTTTWTRAAGYKLGSQNPVDNIRWGLNRVELPSGLAVAPGQEWEFVFEVQAPAAEASYAFQWRMVREGVQWFGQITTNVAVDVDVQRGWASTYISRPCRMVDIGMLPYTAPPPFDPLSYADRMRDLGCRFAHWGGSVWVLHTIGKPLKFFEADDPYWANAQAFIERANAGGPPMRFSFGLSEVVKADRVSVSEGREYGFWPLEENPAVPGLEQIAPRQCMSGRDTTKRFMFFQYWPTADKQGPLCTPAGQPVPPGGCRCSSDPTCQGIQHYCPVESASGWSVPSIAQPNTRNWWKRLAELACNAGFSEIDFSVYHWTGNLDPGYVRLAALTNDIRSGPCGADTHFEVEDGLNPVPVAQFQKRVAKPKRLADCGSYAGCGCEVIPGITGTSQDLCIPKTQFDTTTLPPGSAAIFVELDLEQNFEFATLPRLNRRRFIEHSLRSAQRTYSRTVPAFFEIPFTIKTWPHATGERVPADPGLPEIGYRWSWNGLPLCEGIVGKVFHFLDAAECGFEDMVPAGW